MNPVLELRPATTQEQMYCQILPSTIREMAGSCGWLCGNFGASGKKFNFKWYDVPLSMRSQERQREADALLNLLRKSPVFHGILNSRQTMTDYCHSAHDRLAKEPYPPEYAFRADLGPYSCNMRLSPGKGKQDFFMHCYRKEQLDAHLSRLGDGIRILTPNRAKNFRVLDGDTLRMVLPDGHVFEKPVYLIDKDHFEFGEDYTAELYHVREFSQYLNDEGIQVIPIRANLPKYCYSTQPSTGVIVLVERGENKLFPSGYSNYGMELNRRIVDFNNRENGITHIQEAAMLAGVLYGWSTPAADPKNYDTEGNLLIQSNPRRSNAL